MRQGKARRHSLDLAGRALCPSYKWLSDRLRNEARSARARATTGSSTILPSKAKAPRPCAAAASAATTMRLAASTCCDVGAKATLRIGTTLGCTQVALIDERQHVWYDIADAFADRVLMQSLPCWERWFLAFRAVQEDGEASECRW